MTESKDLPDLPKLPPLPRKVRTQQIADGRIGFPDVVMYEMIDGPFAGVKMPCPPMIDEHHNADRKEGMPGTYAYVARVLDREVHEILRGAGILYHPRHTGAVPNVVDNRAAPQR